MSGQYLSTFDSTMEKWNHFIEVPPLLWPRRNIIKIYDRPHVPYSASHPISSWYEINFYEQFAFPLLRFIGRLKSYWNKCRVSSQRIIFENIGFRDRPGKRESEGLKTLKLDQLGNQRTSRLLFILFHTNNCIIVEMKQIFFCYK